MKIKTPFQIHLDALTKEVGDEKPKAKKILKKIAENPFIDELIDEGINQLVDLKNKDIEFKKELEKKNVGASMIVLMLSKKIERLVGDESLRLGIDSGDLYWKIFADYFNVDVKECDPAYWDKLEKEKKENK